MGKVALIHQAFNKATSDVEAAASVIRTTRRDVQVWVDKALGEDWKGSAADSYQEPWVEWLAGAKDMEEGLVAMRDLLIVTHADFREKDADSERRMNQIAARIVDRLSNDNDS